MFASRTMVGEYMNELNMNELSTKCKGIQGNLSSALILFKVGTSTTMIQPHNSECDIHMRLAADGSE